MSVTQSKVVCDVEFVAVNRNTPWHMPWMLLVMLQPKSQNMLHDMQCGSHYHMFHITLV